MQITEQIPDGIKLSAAVGSSVLTFLGFPIEQWMYVLSAVVSILFIIEKLPIAISRIVQLYDWIRDKKNASCK